MSHSRWNLPPNIPEEHPLRNAGLPPLVMQLLYNRGITDREEAAVFLAADGRLAGDPMLLPDMHQAIARIYRALLSGERIAVYGDFDTDGITATALLVQGLAMLNCPTIPYIPHRLTEGHGLQTAALEKLCRKGVSLVISVDCGITALTPVRRAKRLGLDIIITDHHIPPETIPPAYAVVDPKLPGSNYPYHELAGVGVAFKLLQALFRSLGKENQLGELLDLVALGTVADMVPLLGENRHLVRQGLLAMQNSNRLGLREIANQARLDMNTLDTKSIAWVIAPRLNAAGRLDHAMGSYQLLMSDTPQEARSLATWLEQKNAERQRLTTSALAKAREQVMAQGDSPLLIAADRHYPAGIAGLVAGRLTDEFYRPTVVVRIGEQFSSSSCRSIPEFDITSALNRCRHLLTRFGGHAAAAGFSLPTSNLPRLKEALLQMATDQLAGVDLRPKINIDTEVRLAEITRDTFQAIQQMAPFGQGNPEPILLSRQVEVRDCRTMGNNGNHLRWKLSHEDASWDAVGFGLGNRQKEMSSRLDIVYNLELDRWSGEDRLRLNILDFAPSH